MYIVSLINFDTIYEDVAQHSEPHPTKFPGPAALIKPTQGSTQRACKEYQWNPPVPPPLYKKEKLYFLLLKFNIKPISAFA